VAALAWLVLRFSWPLPRLSAVIPISFTDTPFTFSMPQDGLSLQHWRTFLTSRGVAVPRHLAELLDRQCVDLDGRGPAGTIVPTVGCWRIAFEAGREGGAQRHDPAARGPDDCLRPLGIYRLYVQPRSHRHGAGRRAGPIAVTGLALRSCLTVSAGRLSKSRFAAGNRPARRAGGVGRPQNPALTVIVPNGRAGRAVRRDILPFQSTPGTKLNRGPFFIGGRALFQPCRGACGTAINGQSRSRHLPWGGDQQCSCSPLLVLIAEL